MFGIKKLIKRIVCLEKKVEHYSALIELLKIKPKFNIGDTVYHIKYNKPYKCKVKGIDIIDNGYKFDPFWYILLKFGDGNYSVRIDKNNKNELCKILTKSEYKNFKKAIEK